MLAYELDYDEGIVLQSTSAYRRGPSTEDFEDESLLELVVTNKRIIYVSEISTGFFSKSKTEITQVPITEIKVINGAVQVKQVKHYVYGHCIQIQFVHGIEYWELEKKSLPRWVAEINHLLGVNPSPVQESIVTKEQKAPAFSAFTGFTSAIKGAANTATQTVSSTVKQVANNAPIQLSSNVLETQRIPTNRFCSNCGAKLDSSAKFCSDCGAAVNGGTAPTPPSTPTSEPITPSVAYHEERQQKYVGTVLKCPNCGAVIGETTAVCPDCGFRFTGRSAVTSVQSFKDQLMAIEAGRKKSIPMLGMLNVYAPTDPADKKKLSLIRNFPIPNTVDDILEFMMLAIVNIDVGLSKKSWTNSTQTMQVLAMEMPRVISNAWVAKMQQAYQKAEILFPNDPAFAGIRKLYLEKMKELKIKIK